MKTLKLILCCFFLVSTLSSTDLPPAPDGFSWQEIPELKAAFLRPGGWYFKREEKDGTLAYFITKEDISKGGEFSTGLTVNVFKTLKKDTAVERARGVVEDIATKYHAEKLDRQVGPFSEFSCLVKDTDASGTSMIDYLTIANPKTNTLYLFIFESPESDWDSAWKLGKQIMDNLAIDDDV